jgi:cysteine desulfurase
MSPYLGSANASSRHNAGRIARRAIDEAREHVALAAGAHPSQIFFTSGGTESDNMAIKGLCALQAPSQLAISAIEHPAVRKAALSMQRQGWQVNLLGVDSTGVLPVEVVNEALQVPTGLLSVMLANNETGVVQNVSAIAEIAQRKGVTFHTDAVQALGKLPLDFAELNRCGVQVMSLSGHKIGAPQGVGALVLDKRLDIWPLLHGGGQEKGLRTGTENVAAIVGFGAACAWLPQRSRQALRQMRDTLETGVRQLGGVIFGAEAERLPNTSFFAFPGIDGETLVMALDRAGFAVASGSACSSDSTDPSPVLLAMGVPPELAQGAVRVSFGWSNTMAAVQEFIQALNTELQHLRQYAAVTA